MRLGIISDPHGNSYGLAASITALLGRGVDQLICAGDVIGYYPNVNETIDLLEQHNVLTIAGNHDQYFCRTLPVTAVRWQEYNLDSAERELTTVHAQWLCALPDRRMLDVDGRRVLVVHGSPWSAEEYVYPDRFVPDQFNDVHADIVIMGHTHIPMVRREGERLFINPGSCGQPRDYNPLASYAWLDVATGVAEIGRVPYDLEALQRQCVALGLDGRLTSILTRTR